MFWAEQRAAEAIGTAENTRSGIARGPVEHLHAAHRAADDAEQLVDAEMVDQQLLRLDHVADGDDREMQPVGLAGRRIDLLGADGAHAAAQEVRADDEIFVGVERLARPDDIVPPAALPGQRVDAGEELIAGQGMAHQDGVGFIAIEPAIGLIGQGKGPEIEPGIELERRRGAERHRQSGLTLQT